jgi:hypothetical protein
VLDHGQVQLGLTGRGHDESAVQVVSIRVEPAHRNKIRSVGEVEKLAS